MESRDDGGDGRVDVDLDPAQADVAVLEQGPVAAGAAVGHADAARVDDQAAVDQAGERHVGVAADHGLNVVGQARERLRPPLKPGVDEHHLVVVPRRAVAKGHRAEAPHVKDDRVRQASEQVDVLWPQLGGRPRVDGVRLFARRELAAGE